MEGMNPPGPDAATAFGAPPSMLGDICAGCKRPGLQLLVCDDCAPNDGSKQRFCAQCMIGKKVRVFWPLDEQWYVGVVQQYDPSTGEHLLTYPDGDTEWVKIGENGPGGGGGPGDPQQQQQQHESISRSNSGHEQQAGMQGADANGPGPHGQQQYAQQPFGGGPPPHGMPPHMTMNGEHGDGPPPEQAGPYANGENNQGPASQGSWGQHQPGGQDQPPQMAGSGPNQGGPGGGGGGGGAPPGGMGRGGPFPGGMPYPPPPYGVPPGVMHPPYGGGPFPPGGPPPYGFPPHLGMLPPGVKRVGPDGQAGGPPSGKRKAGPKTWTKEEDAILLNMVKTMRMPMKWSIVAQSMPDRTGKQCRERYVNHLNPRLKSSEWTAAEDAAIFRLYDTAGSQWAKMSKMIPGRTDNGIKNRFHNLRRQLEREDEHRMRLSKPKDFPDEIYQERIRHQQSDYPKRFLGRSNELWDMTAGIGVIAALSVLGGGNRSTSGRFGPFRPPENSCEQCARCGLFVPSAQCGTELCSKTKWCHSCTRVPPHLSGNLLRECVNLRKAQDKEKLKIVDAWGSASASEIKEVEGEKEDEEGAK